MALPLDVLELICSSLTLEDRYNIAGAGRQVMWHEARSSLQKKNQLRNECHCVRFERAV